jgi:hypothetical protein
VRETSESYSEVLQNAGILTEKQINRMADAKLLTEIAHAMMYGITTTNARILKKLYRDVDHDFAAEREFKRRLAAARDDIGQWGPLPKRLAKHFHAYSLILALLHAQNPLGALRYLLGEDAELRSRDAIIANLSTLAAMLELPEEEVPEGYADFFRGADKGTNVKAARETRCKWLYRATTEESV